MRTKIKACFANKTKLNQVDKSYIINMGENAIPPLIEIMADVNLSYEGSEGGGYYPIFAAQILSSMKASIAIVPMLETIAELDKFSEAYIDIKYYLERFEDDLIEPLLEKYEISTPEIQQMIMYVFGDAVIKDERIFKLHLLHLSKGNDLSASYLADYKDKRALPYLAEEFNKQQSGKLDTQMIRIVKS